MEDNVSGTKATVSVVDECGDSPVVVTDDEVASLADDEQLGRNVAAYRYIMRKGNFPASISSLRKLSRMVSIQTGKRPESALDAFNRSQAAKGLPILHPTKGWRKH